MDVERLNSSTHTQEEMDNFHLWPQGHTYSPLVRVVPFPLKEKVAVGLELKLCLV